MENRFIIFPNDDGGVAIVIPSPHWLEEDGNTIEILAEKVVPQGKPFKFVFPSEVPSDRTFRNAWEYVP